MLVPGTVCSECDAAVELSKTWGKVLFSYSVSIGALLRVVHSVPDTAQAMSRTRDSHLVISC